jgi:hypothetical protein
MDRTELREKYAVLRTENGGIEELLWGEGGDRVCERLATLKEAPLSKVQLNQLLGFQKERAVSDDFFRYYWFEEPEVSYKLSSVPGYSEQYAAGHPKKLSIESEDHFFYGMYRVFIDGLLLRGNVRAYFRDFSMTSTSDLVEIARSSIFATGAIKERGPTLPLRPIAKDDRYLISEMACKSYGSVPAASSDLKQALLDGWEAHEADGGGSTLIRALLEGALKKSEHLARQGMLRFSADDMLDLPVSSRAELDKAYTQVANKFLAARDNALENTKLYLSLVNDLDVYVATSMRKREDFREMASSCETIFSDKKVSDLHLRFFDPTMSAADGHHDKGLIECLMVKCAKVLVYCAGEKESYGKDAEAAMALSLGKPVIFFCDETVKQDFYREVHPLSRLINFQTGVAVGAMVVSRLHDVPELLHRIFENKMEYELVQPVGKSGYLQLIEKVSKSVVRLQTNDSLLSQIFWNYYKSHH